MWTRDSWLWWLGIAGAVVLYLSQAPPPTEWSYQQWLQGAAFLIGIVSGKLATSPLKGAEKDLGSINPRKYLGMLLFVPFIWGCGKDLNIQTNPVGTTAHYATQVTRATQGIQQTVIAAETAKLLSTDKTAAVVKVTVQIGVKAQELAAALAELNKLDFTDLARKPIVAKVGLILQTTNELVYQLNLSDYFTDLSTETKQRIHDLLKEIGQLLLMLATEVR